MAITVITPPDNSTVVTMDDLMMQIRWGDDEVAEMDAMLKVYVDAAVTYVEQATRRSLARQTLRLSSASFRALELLRPPVVSVEAIEYLTDAEATAVLDMTDFYLTDGLVPTLVPYSRVVDSSTDLACRSDAVRVTYVTGYDKVPPGLKTAVLLQVQLLADRFDVNEKADLERTRNALMSSFKVHTL